jgi:hypothetical protein
MPTPRVEVRRASLRTRRPCVDAIGDRLNGVAALNDPDPKGDAATRDARKVEHVIRTEHTGLGVDGRFGAGLPRIVFVDQLHP